MNKGIDLVVSFDTTGSMFPVLTQVRQKIASFVGDMFNNIDDLRVGIVAHGDYCDMNNPYTIRVMDFTDNKEVITEFVMTTKQTSGGDADECYELVLKTVGTTMSWGEDRLKVFVIIGDASPHGVNHYENKDRLDWRVEATMLKDLGVKIFAVHALSNYRSSSKAFYETIANVTGGKYLKLDQFEEVVDLIMATCMSEYGEEKLNDFVSIIRSKGKMTSTMANNISALSGKQVVIERNNVQVNGLVPVVPGRFQVMTVNTTSDIKGFVESNGITFNRGRGFYELTKHETIQQYKEVIIQDKETGEMFTGADVRERLGLSPQIKKGGVKESLSSRSTVEFRVFVQSTSFNRKLISGTSFLYEIIDIKDDGTAIKHTPMKKLAEAIDKEVTTNKKKSIPKKRDADVKSKVGTDETEVKSKVGTEDTAVKSKVGTDDTAVPNVETKIAAKKTIKRTNKKLEEKEVDTILPELVEHRKSKKVFELPPVPEEVTSVIDDTDIRKPKSVKAKTVEIDVKDLNILIGAVETLVRANDILLIEVSGKLKQAQDICKKYC